MGTTIDLGGNDLIVNDIFVGASAPGQAGTDITTTDLTALAGVTAGTVTLSKAVIVDANKDITAFRNLNLVNLDAGNATGTAGTVDIFPGTTTTGKTTLTATANSGNTTTTINTAAQASTRTYTVPDAGASTANFVLSTGTSTATTATSTELNTISGVTPGTVIASKALVADSGIKISGLTNATFAAGTATVAPIVLTTGTNLTTAAAGAMEFDGTCFYNTAAASSRQVSDTEQFVCLTADYTLTDSASAQKVFNATTNGAVTLPASTSYFFEGLYLLTNTGTTSHTWATLFAGSATVTELQYAVTATQAGTAASIFADDTAYQTTSSASLPTTALVVTAASTNNPEHVVIKIKGIIRVNGTGTLIPQIKASAQPNGTEKILKGSYFRLWPVGTNTVASVGNWS